MMKWKTKKDTVEQEKNKNSQKSVKSVWLMGVGVYDGKDFLEKTCFSWNERVKVWWTMTRGDEDEGEEGWLRQGWRSEAARKFVPEMRWGMSEWAVCDFQRGAGWMASKSDNRGSVSTDRRLDRDKVMYVVRLSGKCLPRLFAYP